MTFRTVPFAVVGGTHQNRSRALSSELTVNMFPQRNNYGRDSLSLQSFPGQKLVSTISGTSERGTHVMNEVLYRVVDNNLYEVNSSGEHFVKGSVTGSDRCIFADDGDNLVIVSDKVYIYTKSSDTFKENTNVNLVNVLSVGVINSQFIYTTPDLSFLSQPGIPDDVSGLDGIGAESNPDKLVRDYPFDQTIYRFGKRTCEPWYNSGTGSPPIDRIEGQQFSVGLAAINSTANTDNALYWLGDDKSIYRVRGGINERVSDDALSNAIENMTKFDDAIGNTFTLQGQDFYMITFPSEGKTYVFNESVGQDGWFNLSSTNQKTAYSGTSIVYVYNKLYVASGGKLLTLELNEYTQDTDVMIRERITAPITAKALGVDGNRMMMSRMELFVEAGVGLISGQGERPRMMIETSIDGGRSYAHSDWVELGQMGEHTLRCELWNMMSGESFVFRITMSDPVPLTISGGVIDIRLMGR